MFVAPSRRWSPLALVVGVALALTSLVAPADASTTRTVTAAAHPVAVPRGTSTTVSGTLTGSPVGSPVQVQRKVGTGWRFVRSATTTNTAGHYAAAIRVPTTAGYYSYRVFAPSRGGLRSAVSRTFTVIATRPVRATIRRSVSAISAGDPVTLSGTVSPFVRGTSVAIQRKVGTTWRTLTTTTLSSTGRYRRVVHPTVTTAFRVLVPRRGLNSSAVSGATTVGVLQITTTTLPTAAQQFSYSAQLTENGGKGVWSMARGVPPFGLSLSASGLISGTPEAVDPETFTVRFAETSTGRTATKRLSIHVVASVPPTITTASLPDATKRSAYSAQLSKSGASGTWSLVSGSLPSGLKLNSSGAISGVPTLSGTASFTVRFTESGSGLTDTKPLSIKVNPVAPTITTTSLPDATRTKAYSFQLVKNGGAGTWSLLSGSLPTGITLNSNGLLSGTPTETPVPVTHSFTVKFTESDADALSATQALSIHLNEANAPTITTTSLPDGTENTAYSGQLNAGESGTWAITAGALPDGIVLDPNTGALSGTPTVFGDFGFTVTFTSTATSLTSSAPLSIHVAHVGPTITTTSLPDANQGVGYNDTLTKTGLAGLWSITAGALPAGLGLNVNTGLISGTPTTSGDFPITVTFTESSGGNLSDSKALSLHVIPGTPPTITTTSLPDAQQAAPYKTPGTGSPVTLTKTAGVPGGNGTWSITAGALPAGITLAASGVLSGTPTVSGDFGFTVTYTENASTLSDSKALSLHVNPATPPTVTTTSLPNGVKNQSYSATLAKTAGTPGGPGTWSITAGVLPAGISLNASTGALSGFPSGNGDNFFTVRYTETASGLYAEKALSIHVSIASTPVITTSSFLPNATVGVTYSTPLNSTGTTQSWSLPPGSVLPPGLSLSSSNSQETISGVPTTPGSYTFSVKVTTLIPLLGTDTRTFKLTVVAP